MMTTKTPQEIEALKARYAADNAAKAATKAAKKQAFADANAERQMPVVEMRIPDRIDLEKPPWDSLTDALEYGHRFGVWLSDGAWPDYPMRRKIIRTTGT